MSASQNAHFFFTRHDSDSPRRSPRTAHSWGAPNTQMFSPSCITLGSHSGQHTINLDVPHMGLDDDAIPKLLDLLEGKEGEDAHAGSCNTRATRR